MAQKYRVAYIWFGVGFAGLLLILLPMPLGMDGFDGGFALAVLGILVITAGITGGVIYLRLAKAAGGIMAGENMLADWKYTLDEWQVYTEEEHRRDLKGKWGLWGFIGAIAVVVGIIFALVTPDAGIITFFTIVGLMALLAIVVAITTTVDYQRNKKRVGEVRIASDGLYINGVFHYWKAIGTRLEGVVYHEADRPYIEFSYSAPSRQGRDYHAARVPVPTGKEDEAKKVVAYFEGRATV
jgi:hypothetical protein